MFIDFKEKSVELSTKLGTAMMIEKKFKLSLQQVFTNLGQASVEELTDIIEIAAKQVDKEISIKTDVLNEYDYTELISTVKDIIVDIMFAGTPEQIEAKFDKMKYSEEQKNEIREMKGLPIKQIPTTPTTE